MHPGSCRTPGSCGFDAGCFCLSLPSPDDACGTQTSRVNRSGAGGGQGRRGGADRVAHGGLRQDLQVEVRHNAGRQRGPLRAGSGHSQPGVGTAENPRGGRSDPVPSPQSSRRQSNPLERTAQVP